MTDQELPGGVVLDQAPDTAPAQDEGGRSSLRGVSAWTLVRLIPSVFRSMLAGREPVGGLPVVEPGRQRPAELREIDFGESAPTAEAREPVLLAETVAEVAASLGVDLDTTEAAAQAAEQDHDAATSAFALDVDHAAVAEAVAELGEPGL